jgi:histidinol-phosphatase
MSGSLLQAADDLARLVGETAMRGYRRGIDVEIKADGSPVTAADRAAESVAREWLASRFPRDGIVGEEFGERVGSSGRRWLLDPIDGTKTFVRGVPLWGSLVACLDGDSVVVGAASFPGVGEHLVAAPGEGCWCNGARARVSSVDSLADSTVLTTDGRTFRSDGLRDSWHALASSAALARTWGDCYGYLLVATGRAEVMVDARLAEWDAACFVPIIEEAGGVFSDLRGARTAFGGDAIATNAALSGKAREYFR